MSLQSVEICKITGKSKFIPKSHNFFPLLPPISPAEAKKLSQKPNYIPIYYLLKPPSVLYSELSQQFKAYQVGDMSNLEYFYKIRDLVLLLPSTMEQLIVNGDITDMRISRDTKSIQVMKRNKQRWETTQLSHDSSLNLPVKPLKPGAGPSQTHQLRNRKSIFEILNSNADQEELDAMAKIEPDLDKVERLRKRFDRSNLKLGLEPSLIKTTPSPFTFEPSGNSPAPQVPSTPVATCEILANKIIPGIVAKTKSFGPRFIPGQYVNVDGEGNGKKFFIPGQIMRTKGRNSVDVFSKFVPGITFQVNDDVHFVPGRVEKSENGNGLKFAGSKIVSTDEGLHFIAEDMITENEKLEAQSDESANANAKNANKWSILVQGFETEFNGTDTGDTGDSDDFLKIKSVKSAQHIEEIFASSIARSRKMEAVPAETEIVDYSDLLNQEIQFLIENELNTIVQSDLAIKPEKSNIICTNLVKHSIISHRPSIQLKNFDLSSPNSSTTEIQADKNDDHRVSITELPQTPPVDVEDDIFHSGMQSTDCLDSSAAKYKISVRPQKRHHQRKESSSSRSSIQEEHSRFDEIVESEEHETATQGEKAINIDIETKREVSRTQQQVRPGEVVTSSNIVDELIETEKEFIQDIEIINKLYYEPLLKSKFSHHATSIFGNLNDILDFHKSVLMEGLKYAADDEENLPKTVGRTFMRLERDFDKHMQYYKNLSHVHEYLAENHDLKDFLEEISGDSSQLISQLHLPIQRLVDYKVILSDLNNLSPHQDLSRTVNFIETLEPSGNDDFLQSIEGFSGDLRKLGKLIKHDWFSISQQATGKTQERYLFLFKDNILVTKVRRVSPERSIFIAKDLIKLSSVEVSNVEHQDNHVVSFELSTGTSKYTLQNVSTVITTDWLKNIKGNSVDQTDVTKPKLKSRTSDSDSLQENYSCDSEAGETSQSVNKAQPENLKQAEAEVPQQTEPQLPQIKKVNSDEKVKRNDAAVKVKESEAEDSVINVSQKRSESKSNMLGERRSSVSELIHAPVKSTQVEPGDSATFQVKTRAAAVVTWLKDNRPLDDRLADRVKITSLQNNHKLVLLNCRDEDSGLYSARVVDPDGTKQALCSGQLVVHELTPEEREQKALDNKPSFVVKFPDTELIEGSTVCLMIHAKGDPEPQLQIFKDGKLLKNDEKHVFDGEELIIEDIKPEDGGIYKCIAKNVFGSDEFQAIIQVVHEKQLKMPDEGDTSSEAYFQWFKDGHSFAPEERFKVHFRDEDQSLALLFQHVDPGDAGLYTCVGTTSSGRISCSAELTVQGAVHQLLKEPKAPCVITELTPIEVNLSGSAMLELKVEGFPRPTLKWYHNDSAQEIDISASPNYKLIHDNEDVTLLIKNVELAHGGLYKVVASNELGVCDSKCMMTIKSPPTFSRKLDETVNVLKDAPLKLEAKVECSPAPTIKWYKDGKQIQSSKHVAIEGSVLTISKAELQDAGSYSITASNELGQMAQFSTVNVNQCAKITKSLEEIVVKSIGETAEFEIQVVGTPDPTITWEINGKAIDKSSKKYEIKDEGNDHKLIVKGLVQDDSCNVKVKVANEFGSDEASSQLKINRPPKITGKLKPVIVNLGDSATFNIKVDSYPAPKVKWWLGDVEIDSKRYQTGEDGSSFTCKIPNVEASGTVKVKVSNDYGFEEDEAQLTVKCKPSFKKGLKDITVVENETLDVSIELKGSPEPQVTFFHNGNEVTTDARIKIKKTSSESYHMTFNVVIPSDAGKWKCVASNELGEVSSECTVTVEGVPKFEKRLEKTIEVFESENFEVQVSVSGVPRPVLKWYLNSTELQQSSHISITENETETEITNTFKIHEITLDEVGELKCTATNARGGAETVGQLIVKSEPKKPIITTKLESVVAEKGTNVELMAKVKCSLVPKLKWFKDDVFVQEGILQNGVCKLQLANISDLQSGKYSLKAVTDFGEDESKADIDVVYKPSIEVLRPVNVGIGEERVLTANVKAHPAAQISWITPAGDEIKQHELTVKGEPGQDGVYKVVAVNPYGRDEATVKVSIKMTPPELIQGLPRRHGIKEGEDLILKLQVGGSPLPTVAWLRNGEPIKDGEAEMSMAPDGTAMLIIRNAKPGDAGKYTAVITNPSGEISCPCQVEIERIPQKPEFLEFPKVVELVTGQPLKLEGKISGFPDPSLKWFKDGEPLKPSAGILSKYKDGVISLEIKNPGPDDLGRYTAILSNPSGETRQDVQVVPPTTAPKFTSPFKDINVMEGYPYELEATLFANPAPQLSLLADGEPSAIPIEIKTLDDGSLRATVAVPHCLSNCQYSLVAQNAKGSTKSPANVTMVAKKSDGRPPKFVVPLKDLEIDEGSDLKLEVVTEGCPVDVLWWNCDEVEIPGHFDGEKASLKMSNIKPTSSGKYKCRIVNEHGEDECECQVVVRKTFCAPSFLQKLVNTQQVPKRDCKLVARISGLPAPSVSWYKDGKPLKPSEKYIMKQTGDNISLTVTDCNQEQDDGTYSCRLKNSEGEATSEATLAVVDKVQPSAQWEAPYFLKTIGNTEVMLGIPAKFTACISGQPNPDYFWYHNDTLLQPSDRIQMQREGAGLLRLVIAKPQETDLGAYRLVIRNTVGEAECAGSLTLDSFESKRKPIRDDYKTLDKTKQDYPNPLPDAPIISVMTDRRLTLSWKPSLPSSLRFPVTYTIEMCECKRPGTNEQDGDWFTVRSGIQACISDIHNLTPGRDYKFRIRVENKYGISDPSPYAITLRSNLYRQPTPWTPKEAGSYDLSMPSHDGYTQPPRFLSQDSDTQYLEKNLNGSLRWWVYGYPKPDISIINLKNNEEIKLEPYTFTYRDSGEIVYFIKRMTENDVGEYEAVAKNPHGEARQKIRLAIGEHPKFIKHLDETFIFLHKSGKLTAQIFGVPMPKISLFKDWQPLADSARIRLNINQESENTASISISISDSISKDFGMYSIQATNCIGTASSSAMVHIDVDENEFNWHSYRPTLTRPRVKPFHDYYDVGAEIGRGTQGITYHLTDRNTGRAYAGKRMLGERWRVEMRNERSILEGLNQCQYISRMVDSFEDTHGVWIVQELCGRELVDGIDLWSERLVKIYVRQILIAVDYLHELRIAHLGLNLRDILLAHDIAARRIKIIDFGLARHIGRQLEPMLYGQPEFVSPEIAHGEGAGFPADIWSVGIITHLLLSGRSPFRGEHDKETLIRIQGSTDWSLDHSLFRSSEQSIDFLRTLLRYNPNERPDVKACLRHPWLLEDDFSSDTNFDNTYLKSEYSLLKGWYKDANCRDSYRRKPLAGAFTHPSRMVYPPGEDDYERTPYPKGEPRDYICPEPVYPRPNLDMEVDGFKSESHYTSGPDTYLLQLRDPDFPARLRSYMKVASNRSPALALQLKGTAYDRNRTVIRERRRFTDVMDEEVDDERKTLISHSGPLNAEPRRLRHELGARINAEKDALLSVKREGKGPFIREKPDPVCDVGNEEFCVHAVVDSSETTLQWFKNDVIMPDLPGHKQTIDETGLIYTLHFRTPRPFDAGVYKILAANKFGQFQAKFRINTDEATSFHQKLSKLDYSRETQPPNMEGGAVTLQEIIHKGAFNTIGLTSGKELGVAYVNKFENVVPSLVHVNIPSPLAVFNNSILYEPCNCDRSLLQVLAAEDTVSEQILSIIVGQILDGLKYLHWRGYALLNLNPSTLLLSSCTDPHVKIVDFSELQVVSPVGTLVSVKSNEHFELQAPELQKGGDHIAYHQTDVWSVGVLLYLVLSGVSPFRGGNEVETCQNIQFVRYRFEHLYKDISQEATRFLMAIFKKCALNRPTYDDCLEHRWLSVTEFVIRKKQNALVPCRKLREYLNANTTNTAHVVNGVNGDVE